MEHTSSPLLARPGDKGSTPKTIQTATERESLSLNINDLTPLEIEALKKFREQGFDGNEDPE